MIVYRIGRKKWANDLTGEGARLHGGRWNNIGVPCLYTSGSRALSVLEYSCHVPIDDIPRALTFTLYTIPDDAIFECAESDLPGNWRRLAHSGACRNYGSLLLSAGHLVLKLPSVVLPYEYNYLLNPAHPDFKTVITIHGVEDYAYDIRVKE
ncbi:RES family NAD+ phosphorylase [Paraflavisolibacter sp. H34]|uniref:RES family NAD+ phosphorylase n=1 Tax=Huijunlia imazamoxiresistens TaxID=3127457 RepID=UPI0030183DA9